MSSRSICQRFPNLSCAKRCFSFVVGRPRNQTRIRSLSKQPRRETFDVNKLGVEPTHYWLPHVLSEAACRAVVERALLDASCRLTELAIDALFVPVYSSSLNFSVSCDIQMSSSMSLNDEPSLQSVTENYVEKCVFGRRETRPLTNARV